MKISLPHSKLFPDDLLLPPKSSTHLVRKSPPKALESNFVTLFGGHPQSEPPRQLLVGTGPATKRTDYEEINSSTAIKPSNFLSRR
jgi:hypothetical protein